MLAYVVYDVNVYKRIKKFYHSLLKKKPTLSLLEYDMLFNKMYHKPTLKP